VCYQKFWKLYRILLFRLVDAGRVEPLAERADDVACTGASRTQCHSANRESKHKGQPNAKRKYK
jgi:hypothetical protein